MLVPNYVAGAVIGNAGLMIGEIELISSCRVHISEVTDFFPGTEDRIIVMDGTLSAIEECLSLILRKLLELADPDRRLHTKLAVPRSAVSGLIGIGGKMIQGLSSETGCSIHIRRRLPEISERLVVLSGAYSPLVEAVKQICRHVQTDANLQKHLVLKYPGVKLQLGAWEIGARLARLDMPIIHPEDVSVYTKRELIEYLRATAPRDMLAKRRLLGSVRNVQKSTSLSELADVVAETWVLMAGDLSRVKASRPPRPAVHPVPFPTRMPPGTVFSQHRVGGSPQIRDLGIAHEAGSAFGAPLPVGLLQRAIPPAPLHVEIDGGLAKSHSGFGWRLSSSATAESAAAPTSAHAETVQAAPAAVPATAPPGAVCAAAIRKGLGCPFPRVITAWELLEDSSDSESVFCGPPSEFGDSTALECFEPEDCSDSPHSSPRS